MCLKSRCYSHAIHMSWSMSSMHTNFWFVQTEVKQRILNINRSCIIEHNLLLLLVSYKLIFRFFSQKRLESEQFPTISPISVTKTLLLKNVLKWKKKKKKPKHFFSRIYFVLSMIQFITLFFKFIKDSSLSTTCYFSNTKQFRQDS